MHFLIFNLIIIYCESEMNCNTNDAQNWVHNVVPKIFSKAECER